MAETRRFVLYRLTGSFCTGSQEVCFVQAHRKFVMYRLTGSFLQAHRRFVLYRLTGSLFCTGSQYSSHGEAADWYRRSGGEAPL